MTELEGAVRHRIYDSFRRTGRAPSPEETARALNVSVAEVERGLDGLAAAHLLVLQPGTHAVWMAHPFSAVDTPYRLSIGGIEYIGNCAWDAIAIAVILGVDTTIDFTCAATKTRHTVRVGPGGIEGCGLIHVEVPPRRFWDDVGYT